MTTAEEIYTLLEPHWELLNKKFEGKTCRRYDGSTFPEYSEYCRDFVERCLYHAAVDYYQDNHGPFGVFGAFNGSAVIAAKNREDACRILVLAYEYNPFPNLI